MKEDSIQKYLGTITEQYLKELYGNIESPNRNNKSRKSKEKEIYADIENKILKKLTNMKSFEEINQLKNILEGKSKLGLEKVKDKFIFFDKYGDKKQFIPMEFKEMLNSGICDKVLECKIGRYIFTYVTANGLIPINRLLKLIIESGFDINKEELLKLLDTQDYGFKKENDIIYADYELKEYYEKVELLKAKEQYNYRVFSDEEIEDYSNNLELRKKLINTLKKYLKKYPGVIFIIEFDVLFSDINEKKIYDIIKEQNIELTDKEYKDLYKVIKSISNKIPKWLYNGYVHEEDIVKSMAMGSTNEEKRDLYIYYYLLINGIIKIDKLKELLEKSNIEITEKEIKGYLKEDEEFKIEDNYICHTNIIDNNYIKIPLIDEKAKMEYKVIDNLDKLTIKMDKIKKNIEDICHKYNIKEDDKDELFIYILYGFYNKELLIEVLEDSKTKLSKEKLEKFYSELYEQSKEINCWRLNGYSKKESMLLNNVEIKKIGRNDLCPCGSGLKYKKCCGK
jgi:hypothetical protein